MPLYQQILRSKLRITFRLLYPNLLITLYQFCVCIFVKFNRIQYYVKLCYRITIGARNNLEKQRAYI